MADQFHVSFKFSDGRMGWIENFYWTAANAGIAACITDAGNLALALNLLCTDAISLDQISVLECDVRGVPILNGAKYTSPPVPQTRIEPTIDPLGCIAVLAVCYSPDVTTSTVTSRE